MLFFIFFLLLANGYEKEIKLNFLYFVIYGKIFFTSVKTKIYNFITNCIYAHCKNYRK